MAFCTNCGATVNGAFCTQCGAAASGAAAGGPATPVSAAPAGSAGAAGIPSSPQPVMAVPPRRTSPLVWVLVIVLGLFILGGIAFGGLVWFGLHKARQAGFDPELMQRNPGLAITKMLATVNPDVEVLHHDDAAGTITVRDKKTGKVSTVTFDQAKNGKFSFTATDDSGKSATLEFGADSGKLPSWVPAYPGAKVEGTFAMRGSGTEGLGGSFAFTTADAPAQVMSFYQDKAKDLGLKVKLTTTTPQGGMVVLADDGGKQNLSVIVSSESGKTSVNVTYGMK